MLGAGHLCWGQIHQGTKGTGTRRIPLNRRGSQGGSGISCNCSFMCVLSLRHGGVRILLNCEETEVSYSVGYFYFFLLLLVFIGCFYCGGTKDIHDRSWHSKTICPRSSTPNYDTVQDSPFCKVLDTTPAVDERDRFAKQELGQVTSWLIQTC